MDQPVNAPPPRRIIMVGRWRPVSSVGVDQTIVHLTRELLTLGHRVEVWSPSTQAKYVRCNQLPEGIPQFDLPVRMVGLHLPRATREFILAESGRARLAHFHSAFTPANNAIARTLRCPYTVTPNGAYSPAGFNLRTALKKRVWVAASEKAYLDSAAFIHALSEQERTDVRRLSDQQDFVIAPNGIVPDRSGTAASEHASRQNAIRERTLLFLGRLAVHHKGLDRLIAAFAQANLPGARLLLAGPDFRGGEAKLRRLVRTLGVADRVDFLGPVYEDQKWQTIRRADLFVHFSRWEGIPFAVLEAMSSAKPVLVSLGTNLADYVRGAQAGWVAEADDFAGALQQALQAPALELRRRGDNAKKLVETQFLWPAIARKVAAGYNTFCT